MDGGVIMNFKFGRMSKGCWYMCDPYHCFDAESMQMPGVPWSIGPGGHCAFHTTQPSAVEEFPSCPNSTQLCSSIQIGA